MKKNILQEIIEYKHTELESLKNKYKHLVKKFNTTTPSRFKENFINSKRVRIIAEIKPSSPSEGPIFEPTEENIKKIARTYSQYPIGAISVLTDKKYFNGSYENIRLVKEITDIPILCKEFIIDPFQIDLAKYFGADAVLLIAEALPMEKCIFLYKYAKEISLDILFEFHSPENLKALLDNNIDIIGINNRNLSTLKVDIQKCLDLKKSIPDDKILIAESGFNTPEQIKLLEEKNFNGVLIGTSLLKSGNIDEKLKELVYYYE